MDRSQYRQVVWHLSIKQHFGFSSLCSSLKPKTKCPRLWFHGCPLLDTFGSYCRTPAVFEIVWSSRLHHSLLKSIRSSCCTFFLQGLNVHLLPNESHPNDECYSLHLSVVLMLWLIRLYLHSYFCHTVVLRIGKQPICVCVCVYIKQKALE